MQRFWPNLLKIPVDGDFEYVSNFSPPNKSLAQALIIGTIELTLRFVSKQLKSWLVTKFVTLLESAKVLRYQRSLPQPSFFEEVIALINSTNSPVMAFKRLKELSRNSQFTYDSYFEVTVCAVFLGNEAMLNQVLNAGLDNEYDMVIQEFASKLGFRIVLVGESGTKAYVGLGKHEIVNLFLSYDQQGFGLLYPKEFYEVQNNQEFLLSRLDLHPFVCVPPKVKSSQGRILIKKNNIRSTTPLICSRNTTNSENSARPVPAIPKAPTGNPKSNQASLNIPIDRSKSQIRQADNFKVQDSKRLPSNVNEALPSSNNEVEKTSNISKSTSKPPSQFFGRKQIPDKLFKYLGGQNMPPYTQDHSRSSKGSEHTKTIAEKSGMANAKTPEFCINSETNKISDQNSHMKNSHSLMIISPSPIISREPHDPQHPKNHSKNLTSGSINPYIVKYRSSVLENYINTQESLVCIICNRSIRLDKFNKISCKNEAKCKICLDCRKQSSLSCRICGRDYTQSELDDISVL